MPRCVFQPYSLAWTTTAFSSGPFIDGRHLLVECSFQLSLNVTISPPLLRGNIYLLQKCRRHFQIIRRRNCWKFFLFCWQASLWPAGRHYLDRTQQACPVCKGIHILLVFPLECIYRWLNLPIIWIYFLQRHLYISIYLGRYFLNNI